MAEFSENFEGVCEMLHAGHAKTGHTAIDTLNRLFKKRMTPKGGSPPPLPMLSNENCTFSSRDYTTAG
jgi:hypothetical protein